MFIFFFSNKNSVLQPIFIIFVAIRFLGSDVNILSQNQFCTEIKECRVEK